ncbi:MAG: GntR family transcriptional regulator [Methylococcaceae bacterium NSP1-2]|nr:helix-turn-helix domain-containing protein [Methylococcaceae bacterium]OYV20072.1 MAG: GntR family transcriptional regulator [Methylococcaceae bacterium NSP1-2]
MIEKTNDNAKNIIELDLKWSGIIKGHDGGWTAIPNLLLKRQGDLKLKAIELNVLINLIRFWWSSDNAPFPSLEKMAIEMGVSERTVYRTVSSLEENGFIKRVQQEGKATRYELLGLVEKLKIIKNVM